jgi:hypothetical protein
LRLRWLFGFAYSGFGDFIGVLHVAVGAFETAFVAVAEAGDCGSWHPVEEELALAVGANES